eukprot:3023477-Pleurochrysis_carterae.AAC.1
MLSTRESFLSSGCLDGCDACFKANSTRLPHTHELYKPSYAGRLLHADIAGPFVRTRHGGFQKTNTS